MITDKMHENEIKIDEQLVRQLLQNQFKQWSKLPLKQIKSYGSDNTIFRLGKNMCIRLPRVPGIDKQINKKQHWLSYLAPHLPLTIPVLLEKGEPEENYPGNWTIYSWLEGQNTTTEPIKDQRQAAIDIAQFITALQKIDCSSGPLSRRGGSLSTQDKEVRNALKELSGIIDIKKAASVWESCLQAPAWNKPLVWIHSDLLPGNLLIKQARINAIIDFDMLGIGDPACDLLPAWSIFSTGTRETFRSELYVDDATWIRGRGWALSIGLIILPYYMHTNPSLVAIGKRLISEVLAESY